jgi:hypothetical protein
LEWLQTTDTARGRIDVLRLVSTLKAAWCFDRQNGPNSLRILQKACKPDFENASADSLLFVIIYTRITRNGSQWILAERKEPGFWEVEDDPCEDKSKFDF